MTDKSESAITTTEDTADAVVSALAVMIAEAVDARLEELGLFEDEESGENDEFTEAAEEEEPGEEEFSEEEFEGEEDEDEDEEDEEEYQPWTRAELQRYDKVNLIGIAEEDFELDVTDVKTKKALIDAILDYQDELLPGEDEEEEPEPEPEPEPVKPKRRPVRKSEAKKTGKKTTAKAGKKGVGKYLK